MMQRHLAPTVVFLGLLAGRTQAKTALLIIDVQDCFTSEGSRVGSLSVNGAHDIVPVINRLRAEKSCLFDEVFFSQDYHPHEHISFASTHGIAFSQNFSISEGTNTVQLQCLRPSSGNIADAACCLLDTAQCAQHGCSCAGNPACNSSTNAACSTCASNPSACFNMTQALWPDHCGSWTGNQTGNDAGFVSTLTVEEDDPHTHIIRKGTNQLVDAYSVFMDNTKSLKTELNAKLQEYGIDKLYIAGIATDFCVDWTAADAISFGYNTTWISDASKGIVSQDISGRAGLSVTTSAELLRTACPYNTAAGVESDSGHGQGLGVAGRALMLLLLGAVWAR